MKLKALQEFTDTADRKPGDEFKAPKDLGDFLVNNRFAEEVSDQPESNLNVEKEEVKDYK